MAAESFFRIGLCPEAGLRSGLSMAVESFFRVTGFGTGGAGVPVPWLQSGFCAGTDGAGAGRAFGFSSQARLITCILLIFCYSRLLQLSEVSSIIARKEGVSHFSQRLLSMPCSA